MIKFKNKTVQFGLLLVLIAFGVYFNGQSDIMANVLLQEKNRNIVIFNHEIDDNTKAEIVGKSKGIKIKDLNLVNGVVLEDIDVQNVLSIAGVERIDEDVVLEITASKNIKEQMADEIIWGINTVNAHKVERNITGPRTKIGILDTGIDLDHPDLYDNVKGDYNAIDNLLSGDDDNGHGTHLAGVIGSVQNQLGIVGIYPKAKLYAIKAFSSRGTAYLSDVIEGIEWAVNNDIEVLNMSFGTSSNIPSLYTAIKIAYDKGMVLVGAVGNNGSGVMYPAKYDEFIAVSGVGSNEQHAWFNNRGPEVDLSAPGVSIYSTINNGGYGFKSGSSMASAFVTGVASILINKPVGEFDTNGNNKWDPVEVKNRLTQTARDKGVVGRDNYYGYGIVDIYEALNYDVFKRE